MGDQFAVRELFRRHYSGLCRFTYRLVHSKEDVEDIVEGVFERIWLNREKLNLNQSIKSYLFKAAQNRSFDLLKRKANTHHLLPEQFHSLDSGEIEFASCSDPVQDMIDKDLACAVGEAIEKLPKKCRLIFTMNRQDGLTYTEIADILSISERTVENQIVRALRHLRRDLRDFIGWNRRIGRKKE
jgi:RNA polymerase sigma-70 factor (ECF subfamily)